MGTRKKTIHGRIATMTTTAAANQLEEMSSMLIDQTKVTSNISASYVNRFKSLPIGVVSKYIIGECRTERVIIEYNFFEHRTAPATIQTVLKNAQMNASVIKIQ